MQPRGAHSRPGAPPQGAAPKLITRLSGTARSGSLLGNLFRLLEVVVHLVIHGIQLLLGAGCLGLLSERLVVLLQLVVVPLAEVLKKLRGRKSGRGTLS